MYEEYIDEDNEIAVLLYTDSDGKVWTVPKSKGNRMYEEYLKTLD